VGCSWKPALRRGRLIVRCYHAKEDIDPFPTEPVGAIIVCRAHLLVDDLVLSRIVLLSLLRVMWYVSLALSELLRLAGRRTRVLLCRHDESQIGRKAVKGGDD
jgi:hypothetical protein